MYHVTFKGLENVAFEFSPVAFTVFGKPIYWYAIIIVIGMILSAVYAFLRAKKLGIKIDDMYDYAIFICLFGIIGARLYYVLTSLSEYKTFLDVIAVWRGGLAIYGGIIAGIITVIVVSRVKKIKILRVLDAIGPSVMIGQAIGRWGNFINQEAFGCNTTLPWGMKSYVVQSSGAASLRGTVEYLTQARSSIEELGVSVDPNGYVHPTFLYESLWNVLGFIIINIAFKRRKFDGQMFLMYITWYGLGRGFIEMLRTDSLFIPGTHIRISMAVGFLCFIAGTALLIALAVRAKKDPEAVSSYAYYGEKAEKMKADAEAEAEAETKAEAETESETEAEAEVEAEAADMPDGENEAPSEGDAASDAEADGADDAEEKTTEEDHGGDN